ncbi:helix-turn-helix domain-containing protein [Azonexus sp.]|uniref:helix-turn-helix domain-containing protein n=1 Tax=Azonexus sp. TaxID=1872668 RepID=UPI0035B390A9
MIHERIKQAREVLKFSQPEAAEVSGIPVGTLRKYEQGPSKPGAEAMSGLVKLGINANWLLTGEGPMLLAELQAPAGALDQGRLRLSLQAVEEGLSATRRTMEPAKKADLVLAVYDLLQEPSVTKERVLKIVKLAA